MNMHENKLFLNIASLEQKHSQAQTKRWLRFQRQAQNWYMILIVKFIYNYLYMACICCVLFVNVLYVSYEYNITKTQFLFTF